MLWYYLLLRMRTRLRLPGQRTERMCLRQRLADLERVLVVAGLNEPVTNLYSLCHIVDLYLYLLCPPVSSRPYDLICRLSRTGHMVRHRELLRM